MLKRLISGVVEANVEFWLLGPGYSMMKEQCKRQGMTENRVELFGITLFRTYSK